MAGARVGKLGDQEGSGTVITVKGSAITSWNFLC